MKKIINIFISLFALVLLSACNVPRIEPTSYDSSQLLLLLLSKKEKVEGVCGADIWNTIYNIDGEDYSFKELFLGDMNNFILELEILTKMAKEEKLTLDAKDEEKLRELSTTYFAELSKTQISKLREIDEESLYNLLENYTKALKMKESMLTKAGFEISESEARVLIADIISFDDEESAKIAKQALEEGKDISSLGLSYNLEKEVKIKKGQYSSEIEDKIFDLSNNQISDVIKNLSKYYIYKIVSSYDKESTKENKKKLLSEKSLGELSLSCDNFAKKRNISISSEISHSIKDNIDNNLDIQNFLDFYEENFNVSN